MKYFLLMFLIGLGSISYSQAAPDKIKIEKEIDINAEEPILFPEIAPEYPGGFIALAKFVSSSIQFPDSIDYPMCLTVYTSFVINTDGTISDIKILRCSPDCPPCKKETIRVIKLMPKWTPGINNGKPVAVTFTLPIRFGLK